MNPANFERLAACAPAIKREWTTLLRGEPALTPLGRPDTLVFLMDATLAQLLAGLRGGVEPAWLHRCRPLIGPAHRHCACGLNPLLKYFTTGELALRARAGPALGAGIEEALACFHALAQHEIDTLCSVCKHRDSEGCALRAPPPAAAHPALPAA